MKGFQIQQKGERRISAALRIMLVVVLLAVQIGVVVAISYFMQEYLALAYGVVQVGALFLAVHIYNEPGELSYKLIWFILLLLAPPVGMILWFLWGGAAQKRHLPQNTKRFPDEPESVRMRSEIAVDKLTRQLPAWSRTANYLCRRDFQLYQNTSVTYLPEGAILLRNLIDRAAKAERFIFLEYFILAEGKLWDELEKILCAKAREGVEVKIIFDDFGNIKRFSGETIDRLREVGVEVFIFNPVHEYVNRLHFNYRDHRKIACIDGDVAYTGGVNIADEYANLIERFGYWKDSGVCLEGEGAWGLTASFIRMCVNLGGVMHNEHDYYRPHTPVKSEGFCQPFTDGPQNNPDNPAEDVFLQMISGARRFLYITTPYFIPDESLMRALCIAGDGGVDVRLMLPGKPDHWYADCVAESYFGELIKHGVKVYRYTPGFLHGKSIMVDREAAFVGSANMDYRSFELDYECGVMVYSAPMIESLLEDMDMIVDRSHLVTAEEWAKRSVLRRVFEPLLRLFAMDVTGKWGRGRNFPNFDFLEIFLLTNAKFLL